MTAPLRSPIRDGEQMVCCSLCGSVVVREKWAIHEDWHRRLSDAVANLTGRIDALEGHPNPAPQKRNP